VDDRHLVHIVGSGHSGSTLLDMLLGSHSRISSLGEAYFLYFNVNNSTPADVCTCGKHVTECGFWQAVEHAARDLLGSGDQPALPGLVVADPRLLAMRDEQGEFRARKPGEKVLHRSRLNEAVLLTGSRVLRRWLALISRNVALHRDIAHNLHVLYEAVRRAHGTPIIVDSTKNPGYFKSVYLAREVPMTLLLVLRDGRAVCSSRMRREGVTMRQAASIWKNEHRKRRLASLTVARSNILSVRYEDLCDRPEEELTRVCRHLGLDFEPAMLDFRRQSHNLGGNPMRHRSEEDEIRRDDRWRDDLSADDLAEFDRVAGGLNRSFGYGDAS
jgi:hypothetical protein